MSIADEPDVPPDVFWTRVRAHDPGERGDVPEVVLIPGAPAVLTLTDGRQFIGNTRRELLRQLERHG